jgi:hypothetical protein
MKLTTTIIGNYQLTHNCSGIEIEEAKIHIYATDGKFDKLTYSRMGEEHFILFNINELQQLSKILNDYLGELKGIIEIIPEKEYTREDMIEFAIFADDLSYDYDEIFQQWQEQRK